MVERVRLTQKFSPYVLPTESLAEWEQEREAVRKDLKPQNKMAEIYADDFAYDNLMAKRFRRASSQRVKKHLPDALYDILCDLLIGGPVPHDRGEIADLVDRWRRNDLNAKSEVSAILQNHGSGEHDVESEALCRSLHDLGLLDQLLTSAVSQRDKALAMSALAEQIVAKQNQQTAKDAVANHQTLRLAHPKRKAG
jgi:hypothetical protein